jgi:hypothetical protein
MQDPEPMKLSELVAQLEASDHPEVLYRLEKIRKMVLRAEHRLSLDPQAWVPHLWHPAGDSTFPGDLTMDWDPEAA